MRTCFNCQNSVDKDTKFCIYCDAPVNPRISTNPTDALLAGQGPIFLTVIQIAMVILGLIVSAIVRQLYQRFVILPSLNQELMNMITGQERSRFWVFLPWFLFPVVFVVALNCASVFYRIGRTKRQVKRDIRAARLLDRLNQGFQEPFSLYLRSFSQEEYLKRKKGLGWYILVEGGIRGMDHETLDLMISSELRHSYPVIALGQPGEKLGAGRLPSTKAEWEALVLLLMKHAKAIFIVPSTSEGVIWEMEHLKDYHEKTVYIMPPAKFFDGDSELLEQHWRETQQEFINRHVCLPDYTRKGSLFMLDEHGQVTRSSVFANRLGGSRILDFVSIMGAEQKRMLNRFDHVAISWAESSMRIARAASPIVISLIIAWLFVATTLQSGGASRGNSFANETSIDGTSTNEIVRSEKEGVSFSHYKAWQITKDSIDGNLRTIVIENNNNASVEIFLQPSKSSLSLEDFAAGKANARPSSVSGTVTENKHLYVRRDIGGQSHYGMRHNFSVRRMGVTTSYSQDFFLLVNKPVNALIAIQAPDLAWDSSEKGFRVILDSLKF